MKTYKVGLIRVLTTEDGELLQLHGKLFWFCRNFCTRIAAHTC